MTEEIKNEEVNEEVTGETEEIISPEEELTRKLTEAEDKYLRLYAEYDNFKKRSAKEKIERYRDAIIDAVAELLPIIDNMDRALAVEVTSDDAKNLMVGVEMVKKQLIESFEKLGVTEIKALGEEFNPNFHDAVMHVEDEAFGENIVCEEFQKGYIYKDEKVVRHSMVKVAN